MDLQLEYECSDVDLKTVADALDKDWRTIAKLLGLDKNDISKIEDGGDENAFAGIVSHWRRRRNDTLTFDGLMTVLRESTEYRGRQDYLDNIMRPILEKKIAAECVSGSAEAVPLHPKCSLDPAVAISNQFSALCEAMMMCRGSDAKLLDGFEKFIMKILGQPVNFVDKVSSVSGAFEFLTSSLDVELLDSVLQEFPCEICSTNLNTYKKNLKRSKYSEHSLPKPVEGMKCVAGVFREVANSSDPLCEEIVAKKSFCSAFKINAGAVRLLGCSKLEDGIITLKWQIFPHMVDVFQEELSDGSLKLLVPLKLRSLRVDNITLYFYQVKDDTEPAAASSQAPATFEAGDAVMVRNVADEVEKLQEGHGGWNEDMAEILGKHAYVLQVDNDKDTLVYVPAARRKYLLNPALLEKTDESGKSISPDIPDKEPSTFEVGDVVVLCDLHKLIALQSKHNGITDDMCQNAGDVAFVVHIHDDKDYVRADMLPMRRTFHPSALIKIPRDKNKVEEGIRFLKGLVAEDSTFMECVKKAQSDGSDVHNLLMAILFRDENQFCDYLEKCHDKINTPIYKKHTALHLATLTGNITFVRILLEKGAKLDSKNEQGFASLHFATMSKFKDITTVLLECKGGDINLKTIGGFTPLMIAATNNENDIVQFLCEYPGNPTLNLDIKNAEGGTALHHAVQHNAVETVEVLLKYGADPTIPNHLGHNCFHIAAINGKESVMEPLVESYPQFANYGDLKDITPLHWACYHGNYKVAVLLLDKTEIDINTQDSSGGTPLFTAAMEGRTNIIHLLIGYGADPNISRLDKDTPLHALLHLSGKMDAIKEVSIELLKIKENLTESLSKPPSIKTTVTCFLVKETADLKKKGSNDKAPIDLIKDDLSQIESFSQEPSNFKGSIRRSSIIPPEKRKAELWVETRVVKKRRDCGHWFCEEHANSAQKKCPRCSRQLKPVGVNQDENIHGKVCPICMKPDIDPLRSFSDMVNLPNDSDDEGEDKNFQQALREMAASAAAEAVEHDCRQQ